MRVLGGRLFDGHDVVEGAVHVDADGWVVTVDSDPRGARAELRGLVVPAPTNAHTHLADIVARGRVMPTSVREAFAPPNGAKHLILQETTDGEVTAGIERALREARDAGVARVLDFREGGPQGAELARSGRGDVDARLVVFGRPTSPRRWNEEAETLAPLVDGIGISGLADQPPRVSASQAAWCRAHRKRLALHFSEVQRESVEDALALEPDLLVHATFTTGADIRRLADAGVPMSLCPRSNALFGNRPPIEALVDAGARLGLGTDNAMFHAPDVWAEAAHVMRHFDALEPIDVLRMACAFRLHGEALPRVSPDVRVVVLDDSGGLRKALSDRLVTVPWRDHLVRKPA